MYSPTAFVENDPAVLLDFMAAHGFATMFSLVEGAPFASHLPLLPQRDADGKIVLLGHLARGNPQWREADGQRVLAVFHGPHAYISPRWYETKNTVPTWNYMVVHAVGSLRCLADPVATRAVLARLTAKYEADSAAPWSMDELDEQVARGLAEGIVAFEITVDSLEGKFKLNQNHPAERQKRVITALLERGDAESVAVANAMRDRS